ELIVLDIEPSESSRQRVIEIITRMSEEIFMPFTVGGGIRSHADMHDLMRAGADKISINSEAVRRPELLSEAARHLGNQCVVASIDYREVAPGEFRVFIDGGREQTELDPVEWAQRCQDLHCGEVMLTSIDRDGMMNGYDVDMVANLSEKLSVPLVVSGGCGSLQHVIDVLGAGASCAAISSMFLFTDHSPIKLRSHLYSRGLNVRASHTSRN
ncbi:MAG: imidazole glycerol phosphate synthase cyclase subunit, partial [Fimbriimonadaceae bacterium]|nr:imidazole glycerol phosphate synthase cyclase subunit [Alphaproteobacteria bacterium]